MTDVFDSLNLNQNEMQNMVIQPLSLAPTSAPKTGQVYFQTGIGLQLYTGAQWTIVETVANKGVANGYAPLDASMLVPIANLPTGVVANTIPLLKGTIPDGYGIVYSATDGGWIAKSFAGIYVYKGTVATYADLPSSGQSVGDTYNVVAAYGDNPPGSNYTWNGTAWDALGGSVDLSAYLLSATAASTYQTLVNLTTTLASTSTDTQYPSAKAVYTADQTLNSAITSEASTRASADSALQTAVNLRALDSAVVHLAGAETLTGQKTMPCPTFTGVGSSIVSAIFEGGAEGATLDIEFGLNYPLIVCRADGAACPLYINSSVIYGVTPASTVSANEVVTASWVKAILSASIVLNGTANLSPAFYAPTAVGTSGQFLKSAGSGAPSWASLAVSDITDISTSYLSLGTSSSSTAQTVYGSKTFNSTIIGSISGNAATATTATKLSNTSAVGSTSIPVYFTAGGVPAVCTSVNLNSASATKLATARTVQVALGSTASASFDGTANIAPGVLGTLAVANGGTGNTSVDTSPVSGSTKMVTSGGLYTAFSNKTGRYTTTITGNGTATSFTITHNLGNRYAVCEVYDSSANAVMCGKTATSTTVMTLNISPALADGTTYTVAVVG